MANQRNNKQKPYPIDKLIEHLEAIKWTKGVFLTEYRIDQDLDTFARVKMSISMKFEVDGVNLHHFGPEKDMHPEHFDDAMRYLNEAAKFIDK